MLRKNVKSLFEQLQVCVFAEIVFGVRCTLTKRKEKFSGLGHVLRVKITYIPKRFAALFSSTRTLKFKAQPTNAFFAAVNQMFGGSSNLPTTAEREVIESLSTIQTTEQCSAVVGSWEEPPNIWLTVAINAFAGWAFDFGFRMLLNGAVKWTRQYYHTVKPWLIDWGKRFCWLF